MGGIVLLGASGYVGRAVYDCATSAGISVVAVSARDLSERHAQSVASHAALDAASQLGCGRIVIVDCSRPASFGSDEATRGHERLSWLFHAIAKITDDVLIVHIGSLAERGRSSLSKNSYSRYKYERQQLLENSCLRSVHVVPALLYAPNPKMLCDVMKSELPRSIIKLALSLPVVGLRINNLAKFVVDLFYDPYFLAPESGCVKALLFEKCIISLGDMLNNDKNRSAIHYRARTLKEMMSIFTRSSEKRLMKMAFMNVMIRSPRMNILNRYLISLKHSATNWVILGSSDNAAWKIDRMVDQNAVRLILFKRALI